MAKIGIRDQVTKDLIAVQNRDEVLNQWLCDDAEDKINLTDIDELNPKTDLPCRSLELFHFKPATDGCSGGLEKVFTADCRVICYFDPAKRDSNIPSLNNLGERMEKMFDDAAQADDWPGGTEELKYNILGCDWKDTYKYPIMIRGNNVVKKLANTIITEYTFVIKHLR